MQAKLMKGMFPTTETTITQHSVYFILNLSTLTRQKMWPNEYVQQSYV